MCVSQPTVLYSSGLNKACLSSTFSPPRRSQPSWAIGQWTAHTFGLFIFIFIFWACWGWEPGPHEWQASSLPLNSNSCIMGSFQITASLSKNCEKCDIKHIGQRTIDYIMIHKAEFHFLRLQQETHTSGSTSESLWVYICKRPQSATGIGLGTPGKY